MECWERFYFITNYSEASHACGNRNTDYGSGESLFRHFCIAVFGNIIFVS